MMVMMMSANASPDGFEDSRPSSFACTTRSD